jgi:hypothetical protein
MLFYKDYLLQNGQNFLCGHQILLACTYADIVLVISSCFFWNVQQFFHTRESLAHYDIFLFGRADVMVVSSELSAIYNIFQSLYPYGWGVQSIHFSAPSMLDPDFVTEHI